MRRPLVGSVLWLAGGQLVAGALYWTFLHTPESNVWMLAASVVLVLLLLVVASMATAGALEAWRVPADRRIARGLTRLPLFVLALAAGTAVWWTAARGDAWVGARSGEITARFIATFDVSDAALVFRGLRALTFWVQWVLAPVVGLTVWAALLDGGASALIRSTWIRHAIAPGRLALATLCVGALVVLPLQVLGWRMSGLPPTWVEPAAVAARLALVGLTATVGWALVCGVVAGALARGRPST